ncbi:hypothetical protein EYF80_004551 [Liparis tanakae]|uniref:Uncharacterized protein n=1 Tax=Liparis tanakae TaxID=230148 RepID=A0A4Z2J5K0_9TELE|nr:hypothetical protein EYF80_004551 [Liparis tanakae]
MEPVVGGAAAPVGLKDYHVCWEAKEASLHTANRITADNESSAHRVDETVSGARRLQMSFDCKRRAFRVWTLEPSSAHRCLQSSVVHHQVGETRPGPAVQVFCAGFKSRQVDKQTCIGKPPGGGENDL